MQYWESGLGVRFSNTQTKGIVVGKPTHSVENRRYNNYLYVIKRLHKHRSENVIVAFAEGN